MFGMVMDFFDAVVRYETRLWNLLDRRLRSAGAVPLGTLTALRVIRGFDGTCRVQELREGLGISVGAASKLVDRLERAGHAVRRVHPEDRRSSLVALTPAGIDALSHGLTVMQSTLDEHLAGARGIADVAEVLSGLAHTLDTVAPGRGGAQ